VNTPAIVSFARTPSSTWKNGLGQTTQLAIHPAGAGSDEFEWRVSIARLDVSAPFSVYPGIERCLAVLRGEMTMIRASQTPLPLTPHSQPVRFAGSDVVMGQVVRGPVLDLNVMWRQSHWHATLRRLSWTAHAAVSLAAPAVLCSLSKEIDFELDGSTSRLNLYDSVFVQHDALLRIRVSQPVEAYLVEFQRRR